MSIRQFHNNLPSTVQFQSQVIGIKLSGWCHWPRRTHLREMSARGRAAHARHQVVELLLVMPDVDGAIFVRLAARHVEILAVVAVVAGRHTVLEHAVLGPCVGDLRQVVVPDLRE